VRIKSQIIVSVLGATALIGLVGAAAVLTQQRLAEAHAVTEATNVSRQFAQTIAFRSSDGQSSLFDRPEALRQFVQHHQKSATAISSSSTARRSYSQTVRAKRGSSANHLTRIRTMRSA
jgi:hypothetical protein